MRRIALLILILLIVGVLAEASSALMEPLPFGQLSLASLWRALLMIALPALGIYGRRHHGR